jgi:hypothetical protein
MERKTIEKILNFLEEKEGKELPKKWFDSIKLLKLVQELENHPDGIQYKQNANLNLIGSTIKKLPDNLYVGNNLGLMDCPRLKKLPDNLYVGYHLYLTNSNITELPNNLYVGGNLFINMTPLADKYTDEEIKNIVTSTGGIIVGRIFRL